MISEITLAQTRRMVDAYLRRVLGPDYLCAPAENGFFIQCHRADVTQPCIVGRVPVEAGAVRPLSDDQLQEIRECAEWAAARVRGELARDTDGYVLRHQARRLARRWLDAHLSMKFRATGGVFIPVAPPVWQFSISFNLPTLHLAPLGVIDVNALTGEVVALDDRQLATIRERVRAVIQHQQLAPAA
jgi:hypothetical protein